MSIALRLSIQFDRNLNYAAYEEPEELGAFTVETASGTCRFDFAEQSTIIDCDRPSVRLYNLSKLDASDKGELIRLLRSAADIQQVGIMVGIRNKETGAWKTNRIGDAIDDFTKEPDVIVQNITQKNQTGDLVPKEVFFAPYGVYGRTMDMPTVYGSIENAHLEIEVTLCDEEGNIRLFAYTVHGASSAAGVGHEVKSNEKG